MDEPTKEAIEGARMFLDNVRDGFSLLSYPADTPLTVIMDEYHRRIAVQLADVRKKARDDALEEAAKLCESQVAYYKSEDARWSCRAFNSAADGAYMCAHSIRRAAIRALKDQPSGEQP